MKIISLTLLLGIAAMVHAQNVGINTPSPVEKFHLNNGNLLISGPGFIGQDPAVLGSNAPGTKLLWISNRAALRAGRLIGNEWNADSIGAFSFAFGSNVNVPGYAGAAFGAGNRVGYYGFAAGYGNTALADDAVAFGEYNRVEGRGGSFVVGENNISKSYALTVVGRYNDTAGMSSANTPGATNPLFVVGNGTANNQRSSALVVRANGNVGIGVAAPFATLDVSGPSSLQQVRLRSTGNDFVRIRMFNMVNPAPFWDIASITHPNTSPSAYMNFFYSASGGGGLNVLSLQGNGNAAFAGTVTANGVTLTSDARLKKDITHLHNVMPLLQQLSGYQYHWKDDSRDTRLQTGLLAQEVEKVMPELVMEDEKGTKSVNYNGLVPYLLEAIKTLNKRIEQLEGK
ncbi:MAG TPA: tail fiber domain-containing protein [Phnomibacter sp.]|nr:tail fiber domain-containing protein [Phnomibacter sp.]